MCLSSFMLIFFTFIGFNLFLFVFWIFIWFISWNRWIAWHSKFPIISFFLCKIQCPWELSNCFSCNFFEYGCNWRRMQYTRRRMKQIRIMQHLRNQWQLLLKIGIAIFCIRCEFCDHSLWEYRCDSSSTLYASMFWERLTHYLKFHDSKLIINNLWKLLNIATVLMWI